MLSWWKGGVKYQLASTKPPSTATPAGNTPPTRAATIASTRYSSSTLGSPTWSRRLAHVSVINGSPRATITQPQSCRRGDSGVMTWRIVGSRRAPASPSAGGREMTWTSIGPDIRTTRLITDPLISSRHRDRPLAPSTIWVAFSARARSTRAAATSLLVTRRYSPPSSSSSWRWAATMAASGSPEPADNPLSATTCTPIRSPLARDAIRAARRTRWSVSGAPASATTMRSRVSHGRVMPCRSR